MVTVITDANLQDIKDSIKYLLDRASESEEVRQLAVSITTGRPDPISAIYDWIKLKVSYVQDPLDKELLISPVRMVKDYWDSKPLAGDCDDQALLAVALYRSIGISSNVVLLDIKGNGFDHAIAEVYSEKSNSWLDIDPSSDLPLGWRESYIERMIV